MMHSQASVAVFSKLKQVLLHADIPPPALVIEVVSSGQENHEHDYVAKHIVLIANARTTPMANSN